MCVLIEWYQVPVFEDFYENYRVLKLEGNRVTTLTRSCTGGPNPFGSAAFKVYSMDIIFSKSNRDDF